MYRTTPIKLLCASIACLLACFSLSSSPLLSRTTLLSFSLPPVHPHTQPSLPACPALSLSLSLAPARSQGNPQAPIRFHRTWSEPRTRPIMHPNDRSFKCVYKARETNLLTNLIFTRLGRTGQSTRARVSSCKPRVEAVLFHARPLRASKQSKQNSSTTKHINTKKKQKKVMMMIDHHRRNAKFQTLWFICFFRRSLQLQNKPSFLKSCQFQNKPSFLKSCCCCKLWLCIWMEQIPTPIS